MKYQEKKGILVPTDFSEKCDNALNHAIKLAEIMHLKVYCLHIIDKEMKDYITNDCNKNNVLEQRLEEYVKSKNFEHIVPILVDGNIFSQIPQVAIENECQLIILGTKGKHGLQQITGSYALKVIDNTSLPVICVQDREMHLSGYKTIIFPMRFGNEDVQKAAFAVMLSKVFDSTIHIFPHYEKNQEIKNKIMPQISQLKKYFSKYNVNYVDAFSDKYTGERYDQEIIEYSQSVNADLILIMSDAEKHKSFFGAWEEKIIFNNYKIPVMCVNSNKIKEINYINTSGVWSK